jgi:hypothetical protein
MMTRYLSGLCVAGLSLCGGGWLIVAVAAFGGERGGGAGRVNLATGAGLVVVGCVTAVAWSVAWRRRLRADGVLAGRFLLVSRREARRNRRQLARDVRRTTTQAKRAARAARRDGRRLSEVPASAAADASGFPPLDIGADLGGWVAADPAARERATGNGHHPGQGPANGHRPGRATAAGGGLASGHGAGRGNMSVYDAGQGSVNGHGPADSGAGARAANGNGTAATGHDGASAADVLGELRTLLEPLLTATRSPASPAPQAPGPRSPAPPAADAPVTGPADPAAALLPRRLPRVLPRQAQSRPGPAPAADDEALRQIAESEEAWW